MAHVLSQLGNIPVTTSVLESLFPYLKSGAQKIRQLEQKKEIIRLKRGLYVCHPDVTGRALSTELIANHLYAPSYISMSSALRYYGLIPESVYTLQSMTLKCSRSFDTPVGQFAYFHMQREAFSVGISSIQQDHYAFLMATPEKALCDLIAQSPHVNLRYQKEAVAYLEEDIRLELEDFRKMNAAIFEAYAQVGKKAESVVTLLKLLKS